MPNYIYICPKDKHEVEIKMTVAEYESVETVLCSQCLQRDEDTPMIRKYTPVAFRFEGGRPSYRRD